MPQVEVPADGRTEIIATPAAFSSYAVNHISGPEVYLSHQPGQTRAQGQIVSDSDRVVLKDLNREPVYAKTPATATDPAILDVRKTGFLIEYTQRTDIDVFKQSSQSVTEVNADQTKTLPSGKTQVTTVKAAVGEVWTLSRFEFRLDATDDLFTIRLETGSANVEIGAGVRSSTAQDTYLYRSGSWEVIGNENWDETRDDIAGTKIDADNGLNVIVENNGPTSMSQRTIRFQFEVTRVD